MTGPATRPLFPPPPLTLSGAGLHLRDWTDEDLPAMVELFDEEQVARWTPLGSPFDLDAARRYLERSRQARAEGQRLQLAVTTDGRRPLGEILLFRTDGRDPDTELGYVVGAAHRGRGLATRAVRLMTGYAHDELGVDRTVLRIGPDNAPSRAVAVAAGYQLADEEPVVRELDGRRVVLRTWEHRRP